MPANLFYNKLGLDSVTRLFILSTGISSSVEISAVDNLVTGLKSNNLWDTWYAIYPFVGSNAIAHSFNLKNPSQFRISWTGSLNHSNTGVKPISGGFGNLNLIPSDSLILNNTAIHFYSGENRLASSSIVIGSLDSSTQRIDVLLRNTGDEAQSRQYNPSPSQGRVDATNINSSGSYIWSRSSSLNHFINKNGSLIGFSTSSGGSLPSASLYIFALNNINNTSSLETIEGRFAGVSKGVSISQSAIIYQLIQSFQTTLNRQVY